MGSHFATISRDFKLQTSEMAKHHEKRFGKMHTIGSLIRGSFNRSNGSWSSLIERNGGIRFLTFPQIIGISEDVPANGIKHRIQMLLLQQEEAIECYWDRRFQAWASIFDVRFQFWLPTLHNQRWQLQSFPIPFQP